jgi:hypothetical protein
MTHDGWLMIGWEDDRDPPVEDPDPDPDEDDEDDDDQRPPDNLDYPFSGQP